MAPPDFKAAAYRHYRDARFLLDDKRWPNADHLAGVAAECGLKAILRSYFGVTLNQNAIPVWSYPSKKPKKLGHVNDLWNELPLIIGGRAGPVLSTLVAGTSPFAGWDIADRYAGGKAITEQLARDHTDKAKEIVDVLEHADLTGAVP